MFKIKIKASEIRIITRDGESIKLHGFDYYLSKNYLLIKKNKTVVQVFPRDMIHSIHNLDVVR